jgi:hypothetical protein
MFKNNTHDNLIEKQYLTVNNTDIDSVVALFSQAKGINAFKSADETKIYVRAVAQHSKIKIYPCKFATHIGINPGYIVENTNFVNIGSLARVNDVLDYSFSDPDGEMFDSYAVSSTKDGSESVLSAKMTPTLATESLCFVAGRVVDSANNPIVGVDVKWRLKISYDKMNSLTFEGNEENHTKTDIYGRFLIAIPRNKQYLLEIESVGYNEVVDIPDQPFANVLDLALTKKHNYSPSGDPQ